MEVMIDIINKHCIGSQEELSAHLRKRGFDVTQATLSRDLKMLKTTKVPTDRGTYMYVMPHSNSLKDKIIANGKMPQHANFQSGFISVEFSGNMAVIKTRNGYASGIAYDIDMRKYPEILGTIPGSDTIFAVIAEHASHNRVLEIFGEIFDTKKK